MLTFTLSLFQFFIFQFYIYLSKFVLKYSERWEVSIKAASAFQPDPENNCIIFKFIWILFQAQGFIVNI